MLSRYVETTTYHGVKDWYKAWNTNSIVLKSFWSLVLLAAFGAVVYYNYVLVVQYMQKSTASKITPTSVDRIHLPNISFSISSRLNKTYVRNSVYVQPMYVAALPMSLDKFKDLFFLYIDLLTFDVTYTDIFTESNVYNLEMMYQSMFNKSVNASAADLESYIRNASFACTHFVKRCFMENTEFDCCAQSSFFAYQDFGAIYQLQLPTSGGSDINLTYQTRPGVNGGLKFYLETNANDTMVTDRMDASGFRIHLTDYVSNFDFSPVHVPAGMQALVRLKAQKYVLDPDIRYCAKNSYPIYGTNFYTKGVCQMSCLINMTINVCNCRPYHGSLFQLPFDICSPMAMLTCVFPLLIGSSADSQASLDKTSDCMTNECPNKCEYWIYEPSVTYSRLSQMVSPNGIVSSTISVFYGELAYQLVEEVLLMDFNTFVSNVGNIAGLYTGISLLSFIQCAVVCLFAGRKKL